MSLLSDFSISLSGMSAAQAQLDAAASNIANANTPGYKAIRLNSFTAPGGGVATSLQTDNSPAPVDQNGNPGSNVDLTRESINLVQAKSLYAANGSLIKADNQMLGTLLDMFDKDHTSSD